MVCSAIALEAPPLPLKCSPAVEPHALRVGLPVPAGLPSSSASPEARGAGRTPGCAPRPLLDMGRTGGAGGARANPAPAGAAPGAPGQTKPGGGGARTRTQPVKAPHPGVAGGASSQGQVVIYCPLLPIFSSASPLPFRPPGTTFVLVLGGGVLELDGVEVFEMNTEDLVLSTEAKDRDAQQRLDRAIECRVKGELLAAAVYTLAAELASYTAAQYRLAESDGMRRRTWRRTNAANPDPSAAAPGGEK